jgi:hypothetical protein
VRAQKAIVASARDLAPAMELRGAEGHEGRCELVASDERIPIEQREQMELERVEIRDGDAGNRPPSAGLQMHIIVLLVGQPHRRYDGPVKHARFDPARRRPYRRRWAAGQRCQTQHDAPQESHGIDRGLDTAL